MNRKVTSLVLVNVAFLWSAQTLPGRADEATSYRRDVQPLLAKHCILCHGPDQSEAGLSLVDLASATAELDSGQQAIVPGDPEASELLRRVTTADEWERMPPEGERLSEQEVAHLRRWIQGGAKFETHWAYQPVEQPPLPVVQDSSWVRNPIDRFVLAELEAAGVSPSEEASRETLIRRLHYDLIGLPPTPEQVDAFLADRSEGAYEKLVERLLASEAFGERWGRHWLDKARYADSDGYEKDRARPNAWRYRDWVIDAINQDLPFDQFTVQQLAGDLLPKASARQKLATAFHRQTLTNAEGGVDKEEFRVEATFDRTEATAAVWMGLTMTCARCHTHKYDQITQREYYQLFAFFNSAKETKTEIASSPEAMQRYLAEKAKHDRQIERLERQIAETKAKLQPQIDDWAGQVSSIFVGIASKLSLLNEDELRATEAAVRNWITNHSAPYHPTVAVQIERLGRRKEQAPKSAMLSVRVMGPADRTTRLLYRGDFLQPGEEVDSDVLQVIARTHPLESRRPGEPPDRLDLARWLVDPRHPLTARVTVNHIWSHLFGRGIVPTVNDFGVRGEQPTHPALLDWLAWQFSHDMGWSRKELMRAILRSATYRQSSHHRPDLQQQDPTNRLFARQNRMRVPAEIVRDLYLSVSGLLSEKVGGPSVFPPLPPGVAELSYAGRFKWNTSEGEDAYRRGMYTFFKRTAPHPTLVGFDCPDSNTSALQRDSSNTPLQALITLNNSVFAEAAQAMARRVLREEGRQDGGGQDRDNGGGQDRDSLRYAIRLCVARSPSETELDRFEGLLHQARQYYAAHPEDARRLASRHRADHVPVEENAAWIVTLRTILNLDEFIVRD